MKTATCYPWEHVTPRCGKGCLLPFSWSNCCFSLFRWVLVLFSSRDGWVTLQDYMAFMISRETENVQSSEEIENAFRALSAEYRPYVTAEELYAVRIFYAYTCVYNMLGLLVSFF